jgi:Na+/H+-dicarboxylate symporter
MATSPRKRLALHWQILIGLVAGIVTGLLINVLWTDATWNALGVGDHSAYLDASQSVRAAAAAEGAPNADAGLFAGLARFVREGNSFIGDLFMNGLRFIAVPIVLFSLAAGVASLNDTAKVGRIGGKTIGIYLLTTAVAISLGLLAANLIGPGNGFPEELREQLQAGGEAQASGSIENAQQQQDRGTWSILLDIMPTNPFGAMAAGNTLQVVVVGLLIGIALTLIPQGKAKPLIAVFDGMTDVTIKIVEMVLILAPYAVFALIVKVVADLGFDVLLQLIKYVRHRRGHAGVDDLRRLPARAAGVHGRWLQRAVLQARSAPRSCWRSARPARARPCRSRWSASRSGSG